MRNAAETDTRPQEATMTPTASQDQRVLVKRETGNDMTDKGSLWSPCTSHSRRDDALFARALVEHHGYRIQMVERREEAAADDRTDRSPPYR